jgi:hypothetical protein
MCARSHHTTRAYTHVRTQMLSASIAEEKAYLRDLVTTTIIIIIISIIIIIIIIITTTTTIIFINITIIITRLPCMHMHASTCIHMHPHASTCIHMRETERRRDGETEGAHACTCMHMHAHA